jgi:hypothetical protein
MKGIISERRMSHSTTKILLLQQKPQQFLCTAGSSPPKANAGKFTRPNANHESTRLSVIKTRKSKLQEHLLCRNEVRRGDTVQIPPHDPQQVSGNSPITLPNK